MKLSLGFSPCPNDTFIFDAWVNKRIDTEGLDAEPFLEDVETLNEWALNEKLDITKLSLPAFFETKGNYVMLNSGSALGMGVGPLVISKNKIGIKKLELRNEKVAIPGLHTTANMLFSFAYPEAVNKKFMVFSAIEDAVVSEEVEMGVIIHESRFTYEKKGLHKVVDLGEYWEKKNQLPIPLGAIAIRKSIDTRTSLKVESVIRKSLQFAFDNYPLVSEYVKKHSQTMSEAVMRQHIDLYVNKFSLDLGEEGKTAIRSLYDVFSKQHPGSEIMSTGKFFLS